MPKTPRPHRKKKGQLRSSVSTVGELLREKTAHLASHKKESPFLCSVILLSKVLGKPKEFLISHPEYQVSDRDIKTFSQLVQRILQGEPLAYVTGEKEFWKYKFYCNPSALIPRPETELLVEKALEIFQGRSPRVILDLGTGTGAVGITLARVWKDALVFLTDISLDALFLAKKNVKKIIGASDRVFLLCGDWFMPFRKDFKADIITVNPPYVSRADEVLLQEEVKRFEPETALFSRDETGLSEIKALFSQAAFHLEENGVILCEVGIGQAPSVCSYVEDLGLYSKVETFCDLSGVERVVCAWP